MEIKNITSSAKEQTNDLYNWVLTCVESLGFNGQLNHIITTSALLLAALIILFIVDYIIRNIILSIFTKIISKSENKWDDLLIKNKVISYASRLIPLVLAQIFLPLLFVGFPNFSEVLGKFLAIITAITIYSFINSILKTIRDTLSLSKAFVNKPLDSYLQVVQIFMIFITCTIIFSILTGKSPIAFLVSLGAASAILMLIFKDTILGFVASIQVSANDSVRVGDWVEMPKYGVDGTVIQMNLNNVKVQNFDKTIVTIPTHTLLTDSFKNYRGMEQSGGRRIKRSINIKISSIRYVNEEDIAILNKIQLLAPFIAERQVEIDKYNNKTKANTDIPVNGRRMTNIGLFRAYATRYMQNNPDINQNMTLMVRQLQPTEHGIPLELYVFTSSTEWLVYENVMANIFDHLLAAIKYFDLEVFELPASDDFRKIGIKA